MLKAVCQSSSRFVSDSIVRVPVCIRVLLRQTRCPDDLFLAQILTLFRSRATFLHKSMILISFVALNDDRIEETVSFTMSQDFLRQVLITTFPSAHEADHYSTARFHECVTWLSFALCHCSN